MRFKMIIIEMSSLMQRLVMTYFMNRVMLNLMMRYIV